MEVLSIDDVQNALQSTFNTSHLSNVFNNILSRMNEQSDFIKSQQEYIDSLKSRVDSLEEKTDVSDAKIETMEPKIETLEKNVAFLMKPKDPPKPTMNLFDISAVAPKLAEKRKTVRYQQAIVDLNNFTNINNNSGDFPDVDFGFAPPEGDESSKKAGIAAGGDSNSNDISTSTPQQSSKLSKSSKSLHDGVAQSMSNNNSSAPSWTGNNGSRPSSSQLDTHNVRANSGTTRVSSANLHRSSMHSSHSHRGTISRPSSGINHNTDGLSTKDHPSRRSSTADGTLVSFIPTEEEYPFGKPRGKSKIISKTWSNLENDRKYNILSELKIRGEYIHANTLLASG